MPRLTFACQRAVRERRDDAGRDAAVLALLLVLQAAREVVAVGVDDRDGDQLAVVEQALRVGVAGVVHQQVVDELHRELGGRPLTGVVGAGELEDRLADVLSDVGADLDAVDRLAEQRRLAQREELDLVRVRRRERLELGVDGRQVAVGDAARGQRGKRGDALLDALLLRVLAVEPRVVGAVHVLDQDLGRQACVREDLHILGAVQHQLGAVLTLIGHVEAERLEAVEDLVRGRLDLNQRRLRLRGPWREQPRAEREARDEFPSGVMH